MAKNFEKQLFLKLGLRKDQSGLPSAGLHQRQGLQREAGGHRHLHAGEDSRPLPGLHRLSSRLRAEAAQPLRDAEPDAGLRGNQGLQLPGWD